MRYLLGILVALAIGWGHCAPADAQELFPLQAVSGGGGSGCLPGSFCPPGNWVNDLDEHFTGDSVDPNVWFVPTNNFSTGNAVQNCQVPGAMVFNHPGLTLYGLPYDFTDGVVNGCEIWSPPGPDNGESLGYSTPGYFEVNMILDTNTQAWGGVFFEFGVMASPPDGSCPGDVAQDGAEVDLVETLVGGNGLIWNGYNSGCTQFFQPRTGDGNAGAHHVWGVDYGDNGAITYYEDGVVTTQWAPTDGVEPPGGVCPSGAIRCSNGNWEGQFTIGNAMCLNNPCTNTDSHGTKFIWVRHYHH